MYHNLRTTRLFPVFVLFMKARVTVGRIGDAIYVCRRNDREGNQCAYKTGRLRGKRRSYIMFEDGKVRSLKGKRERNGGHGPREEKYFSEIR